jgi:hypothetical protein
MEKSRSGSKYKDYITKFKDVVIFVMFLASTIGWISSYISNKSDMKNVLKNNTEAVQKLEIKVDKINDYITQQSALNGKTIEFMENQKDINNKNDKKK